MPENLQDCICEADISMILQSCIRRWWNWRLKSVIITRILSCCRTEYREQFSPFFALSGARWFLFARELQRELGSFTRRTSRTWGRWIGQRDRWHLSYLSPHAQRGSFHFPAIFLNQLMSSRLSTTIRHQREGIGFKRGYFVLAFFGFLPRLSGKQTFEQITEIKNNFALMDLTLEKPFRNINLEVPAYP